MTDNSNTEFDEKVIVEGDMATPQVSNSPAGEFESTPVPESTEEIPEQEENSEEMPSETEIEAEEAEEKSDSEETEDTENSERSDSMTETVSEEAAVEESQLQGSLFWTGSGFGVAVAILVAAVCAAIRKKRTKTRRPGGLSRSFVPKTAYIQGLGSREDQQDSVYVSEPSAYKENGVLLCVADGMGGLEDGGKISMTAATAVAGTFLKAQKSDPEKLLIEMLKAANSSVNSYLSPDYGKGGTTLLLGYAVNGYFYCASVGDSRICLLREGEIIRLNRRHVLGDELLIHTLNGRMNYEDAVGYEKKGALTSYLGMGPLKYFDMLEVPVKIHGGDRFVLMSDGVFNTLSDQQLIGMISLEPKKACREISDEIGRLKKPAQDNYTIAIIAF